MNTCICAAAQHISTLPLLCIHQLQPFHPGVALLCFPLVSFNFVSFCEFSSVKLDVFSYLTPCFPFTHFRTLLTASSLFLSLPCVVSLSDPYNPSSFFFLISVLAFVLSPSSFHPFYIPPLKFHRFLLCASFSVSSLSSLIVSTPSSPLPPLPPLPSLPPSLSLSLWCGNEPVV